MNEYLGKAYCCLILIWIGAIGYGYSIYRFGFLTLFEFIIKEISVLIFLIAVALIYYIVFNSNSIESKTKSLGG